MRCWWAAYTCLALAACERGTASPAPGSTAPTSAAPTADGSAARGKPPQPPRSLGPPRGYVQMTVGGVAPTDRGNAVMLVHRERGLTVPIFVGETEGLSIQLRLEGQRFPRPLTHDLLESIMSRLGGSITSARVDALQDGVFEGSVELADGDRTRLVDSRPSDAIALALGADAPIFVAESVVERAGLALDDEDGGFEKEDEQQAGDGVSL